MITSEKMAAFFCDRCGKCCVSLGPHIIVERQLNDRDYYCRSAIDNEIFLAHVEPEYREENADEFAAGGPERNSMEKKPCIFLRKNPDGSDTGCAIYTTRPKVCRDFRCYRILICDREGRVCGKVIGKNTLRTEDVTLKKLWNEQVATIPSGDTAAWTEKVAEILSENNYCTDIVK
jgi:Fe-S-cluster containining protein